MKAKTLFFGLVLGLSAIACNKDSMTNTEYANAASCTGVIPTYTTDIKAIMDSRCATSGCHNSSSAADGIKLDGLGNIKTAVNGNSNFLGSIHHASGVEAMPRGGSKLSDADIQKMDCWIKNGMP